MTPVEVIRTVKTARLRGRGGAGFPTGMKWEFCRAAAGARKFIICNADEGEPGTFKDRVLLTERPDLVFEGMTIARLRHRRRRRASSTCAASTPTCGAFLEDVLAAAPRSDGLLGKDICGKQGLQLRHPHPDGRRRLRLRRGDGAASAPARACAATRKNRPPFPAQKGYLGCPTAVNNVETLCCVARILEKGPATVRRATARRAARGTKLLSISGDC